jgi:hypothetical protein
VGDPTGLSLRRAESINDGPTEENEREDQRRGLSTTCSDVFPGWYDIDGPDYDCEWYRLGLNYCNSIGDSYSNFGHTANSACCACGGGTGGPTGPVHGTGAFVDKEELEWAVEKYMSNKDAWAASDCDGTPCGDYYGYAQLLTCSCARGEIKEVNGGSPFAIVPTIIAVLP